VHTEAGEDSYLEDNKIIDGKALYKNFMEMVASNKIPLTHTPK
jgi:hypothetical protein